MIGARSSEFVEILENGYIKSKNLSIRENPHRSPKHEGPSAETRPEAKATPKQHPPLDDTHNEIPREQPRRRNRTRSRPGHRAPPPHTQKNRQDPAPKLRSRPDTVPNPPQQRRPNRRL